MPREDKSFNKEQQKILQLGSGMNRFTDHLPFEILNYYPNGNVVCKQKVDTDNHFNGIGLHGYIVVSLKELL
jgi:hypothetical protein